ncbi:MAG: hypothetical protein M3353_01770 [Actinomycetota bacterium]|nr:hypothetical protein [Actinomycetota bacterium]
MPDSTLQERFDALRAESDPPGRRVDAGTVISRARRRRAGRVALAAAAVLAVIGVAVPAVIGAGDRIEPADGKKASPFTAALDPATAGWLGPWELAPADGDRLPTPEMSMIGCFNDGESARATSGGGLAWAPSPGEPGGALAEAVVDQHRTPALAEELVPGIVRSGVVPWCRNASRPVDLTAAGGVNGTYMRLPLDAFYRFEERAQPALSEGELPRGYVLHVWSLASGNRAGMLAIAAPGDAGAPPVGAVFEAFAGFVATDALENSTP